MSGLVTEEGDVYGRGADEAAHLIPFNPDQWRGDVAGHLGNPAAVTPRWTSWVETDAVSFSHAPYAFSSRPLMSFHTILIVAT